MAPEPLPVVLVVEPEMPPVFPALPPILEELVLPVVEPLPEVELPLLLDPVLVLPDVVEPSLVLPIAPEVDDLEVPAVLSLSELPPALLLLVELETSEDDLPVTFPDLLSLFDELSDF